MGRPKKIANELIEPATIINEMAELFICAKLLKAHAPLYPSDMRKDIEEELNAPPDANGDRVISGGRYEMRPSLLYPAIERLENNNIIKKNYQTGSDRQSFLLTREGVKIVASEMNQTIKMLERVLSVLISHRATEESK